MVLKADFISLEEDDTDIVVSFAIPDEEIGIRSLILQRTPKYESFLPEDERGVRVSLEGEPIPEEAANVLVEVELLPNIITLKTTLSSYKVDVSSINSNELLELISLVKKQNYDNHFILKNA